jgi:UDP-N-acetylglucosamine--N-acetylmuramyl-(pentapeptide) pyrophosphoryl-undecaprenol N-acetylglucosamine transferase
MTNARKNTMKFLLTGGHITPAMAVIEELKKRGYRSFTFVGRRRTMRGDERDSAEFEVISHRLGIPFINLTTGKIVRFSNTREFFDFLINATKLPIGFIQSLVILIKQRPDVIISFGGYLALPVVISGRILGIPSLTHEQTVVSGVANKIIAKFAKKVLVSWENSLEHFDKSKAVLSGNPVRKEIFNVTTNSFIINKQLPTIYITGGNQGAHVVNKNATKIIEELLKKYNVIHQTGLTTVTRDYEECLRLEKSFTGKTKGVYIVKGMIYGPEIGEVFSKADLLISRSGANIVTDILALGKLAILIPIPWSINNEQLLNAKMLEDIGMGKIIEEKNLTSELLLEAIVEGMKNLKKKKDFNGGSLKKSCEKAKGMVKLNAAEVIVDEVLKIAIR